MNSMTIALNKWIEVPSIKDGKAMLRNICHIIIWYDFRYYDNDKTIIFYN